MSDHTSPENGTPKHFLGFLTGFIEARTDSPHAGAASGGGPAHVELRPWQRRRKAWSGSHLPQDRLSFIAGQRIREIPPDGCLELALRIGLRLRPFFGGNENQSRIVDGALACQLRKLYAVDGGDAATSPGEIHRVIDHLLRSEGHKLYDYSQTACIALCVGYIAGIGDIGDPGDERLPKFAQQLLHLSRFAIRAVCRDSHHLSRSVLSAHEVAEARFFRAVISDCRRICRRSSQSALMGKAAKPAQPVLNGVPLWPGGKPMLPDEEDVDATHGPCPSPSSPSAHDANTIFVSLSFCHDMTRLADGVVVPAIAEAKLVPYRADLDLQCGVIPGKLMRAMRKSRAVVCLLDRRTEAVSMELGMAMILGLEIVLIGDRRSVKKLPIFLRAHEVLIYDLYNPNYARDLHTQLVGVLQGLAAPAQPLTPLPPT